ncbi:hypothetical protein [Timonella sp. A28]|uniref:hypothetical protein n=1 Tax=Timonella sp. A28 TaxID=3442640 RepID=UPI003EB71019
MPEIGFIQLRKLVQEEALAAGLRFSTRKAHKIADALFQRELFREWDAENDARDLENGLTDLKQHSDTTARIAVRRLMQNQFNNIMKEVAA